jgi:acyl CoA:acetate/3-ketoacid CoA transferase beta subunit
MTHMTNKGEPKIVSRLRCPLTAPRCVRRIFTDLAVIDVTAEGLVLREVVRGLDPPAVQAWTEPPLHVAADCREMDIPDSVSNVRLLT